MMKNPIQIWTGKKCIEQRKSKFHKTLFCKISFQIVLVNLYINLQDILIDYQCQKIRIRLFDTRIRKPILHNISINQLMAYALFDILTQLYF